MVMRGVILGFDGERQRFDGAQVQRRHLFGVLLFVFHAAQVEVIRAIDQVDHRNRQQRGLPARECG